MKKRCLVLIGGVSEYAYLLEQIIKCKALWNYFVGKYERDHIYNLNYQPIMDKHALVMKSIFDPIRLILTPNGWAAERYVNETLQKLSQEYEEVDVISHSQGSWMVMKADVKLNNLWNFANPIGWFSPLARTAVRINIGKPKVEVKNLYYIYSSKDLISKRPPEIKGKWTCKADYIEVIDTYTSHDMRDYISKINYKYPWVLR